MKFMGIDYGMKRIGVAVSDEEGNLAFPKKIILNDSHTFKQLGEILKGNNVDEIVIGESLNFAGQGNALEARIEIFIKELDKNFHLPIRKQKEFLTTVEARKSKEGSGKPIISQAHSKLKLKKDSQVDASAAALILQRYLDKINK
ncbi:MAG: Holliday junction resolvase RuvX, partial [Patescibacteria group bacterium]